MKKSTMIWLAVAVAVIAIIAIWAFAGYNSLVRHDEEVKNKWAAVEADYQRRADLIPNLVSTVKGYAAHESGTLERVTEARAQATQIRVDAADLTEKNLHAYQQAQGAVTTALGRLIAISESYPDLKASENFRDLQAQLEGTENRIAVSRKQYNAAARTYNVAVRRFPSNLLARLFGFLSKPYFQSDEGAATVPEVSF